MGWPCHPPRNLHHQDCPVLDPRGKEREGSSEDHMGVDGRERNAADGKDVEQHSSHSEGLVEVEGLRHQA